jgi:hypothetical protein
MNIEIFDPGKGDAQAAFQRWRRTHPDGFYLNWKSSDEVMLHRVSCARSATADPGNQVPAERKRVCGTSTKELRQWAARLGAALTGCSECKAD